MHSRNISKWWHCLVCCRFANLIDVVVFRLEFWSKTLQSRPNLSSSCPARCHLSNSDQSCLGEATAKGLTRAAHTCTQLIWRFFGKRLFQFRTINSERSPPQVQNFCKWKRRNELVWLSFCCSQYRLRVFTRCWLWASPLCKIIPCHTVSFYVLDTAQDFQGEDCRVIHSSTFVEWYIPIIFLNLIERI